MKLFDGVERYGTPLIFNKYTFLMLSSYQFVDSDVYVGTVAVSDFSACYF